MKRVYLPEFWHERAAAPVIDVDANTRVTLHEARTNRGTRVERVEVTTCEK